MQELKNIKDVKKLSYKDFKEEMITIIKVFEPSKEGIEPFVNLSDVSNYRDLSETLRNRYINHVPYIKKVVEHTLYDGTRELYCYQNNGVVYFRYID